MNKLFCILFAVLMSLNSAFAAIEEKTVVAKGEGLTRQTALMQALSNAAGQAFGIELSSETLSSSMGTSIDTSESSTAVFVDALSQVVREKVATNANQPVTGYRILNDQQFNDGWIVEVEMTYAAYKPLGQRSNRRTAVVVGRDSNDQFLRNKVEQALVASRRFDVVSRRDRDLFADEKNFIRSEDAGRLEVARLGGAQGADYLVIVDVRSLKKGINRETVLQSTGETVYDSFFDVRFSIEVLEFTTREMKWTDEFRVSRSTQDRVGNGEAWMLKYVEPTIKGAVDELLASIFPMRVITVEGDTFLVNRGSQYLKGNESFAVYSEGQALIDPETGESLGSSERHIGSAEVIEVFPKYSRLRLISGSMQPNASYTVRREAQTKITRSSPAKTSKPSAAARAQQQEIQQKKSAFLN